MLEYNTKISSDREKKANLLGHEYKEVIDEQGTLKRLRTSMGEVTITNEVYKIASNSIEIDEKNEKLIFPRNIELVEPNCFNHDFSKYTNIKSIKIDIVDEKSKINLLKEIAKLEINDIQIVLGLGTNIWLDELVELIIKDSATLFKIEAININNENLIGVKTAKLLLKACINRAGVNILKLGNSELYEECDKESRVVLGKITKYETLYLAEKEISFIRDKIEDFYENIELEACQVIHDRIYEIYDKIRKELDETR